MIKTNIKMRVTPEQSRRVQEICFENGFAWGDSGKIFQDSYEWVYIAKKKLYCYSSLITEEVSADLFIKTNGTCEENATDEYYDLREALAKGKIIQLNTPAVNEGDGGTWNDCKQEDLFIFTRNAYRIKDEETYLTKYTSQPKDLESALKKIENLHIALKKKVDKNKNQALEITKLLEQKKAMKYDINIAINHLLEMKELKEKLKEKDTIISYLESKLK